MDSSVLDLITQPSEKKSTSSLRELAPPGSITVRIARTVSELEELRDLWTGWCEDPNADFDFYLVSARCRPDIVRPHVMTLYRDGQPDCMMVGRLENCALKLKVGYTTVFEPAIRRLFFLQGGFLGNLSAENLRILLRELRESLRRGEADHAELARIIPNSAMHAAVRREFGFVRSGKFCPMHEHRWAELPANFESFFQGLSKKARHEFRRHQKLLAKDFPGRANFRCYNEAGDVDELAREVERISAKTYQRALGVGFQPSAEVLDYLRTMAGRDGIKGCILYVEEQPCAYFIGVQYNDTLHGNFMGFDPQFAKYSPGLLVLMHTVEHCFDLSHRVSRVDFGWGDRRYKRVICNQSRQDGPMYLYSLSWAGIKLNLLRSGTSLLDLAARKLLDRSNALQKLKRFWQSRLRDSCSAHLEFAD